ncbi:hypothetical protein [Plesiomonas shigelloides]|uniref:hypothetical protein n=1 Tax=Plesiomonas shigelloides TaxID=703 RepID=UPI00211903C6|nr:hypothetical protein [Plesiomonas shigelloides]MCQ8860076.1 hypothetical protein [Plesiomonas shigelloides]
MSPEELSLILIAFSKQSSVQGNEWITLIAALGGALTTAVCGGLMSYQTENSKQKRTAKCLATSLILEVLALKTVIEQRQYVESFEEVISYLRTNPDIESVPYQADIPEHYSRIYQGQCHNIGLIEKEIAIKIIKFHQLLDAIVQDIKLGGTFSDGMTLKGAEEDYRMFTEAMRIAKELESHS